MAAELGRHLTDGWVCAEINITAEGAGGLSLSSSSLFPALSDTLFSLALSSINTYAIGVYSLHSDYEGQGPYGTYEKEEREENRRPSKAFSSSSSYNREVETRACLHDWLAWVPCFSSHQRKADLIHPRG
jgi:hypothetical protein